MGPLFKAARLVSRSRQFWVVAEIFAGKRAFPIAEQANVVPCAELIVGDALRVTKIPIQLPRLYSENLPRQPGMTHPAILAAGIIPILRYPPAVLIGRQFLSQIGS